MKVILLSGGSGKRLWPLSSDARSKQFLKLLRNNEGQLESMVQRVWRQLANVGLVSSSYIATGISQVDMIQSQLGTEVPLIIEPSRRDTFPAITLAASYLYSVDKSNPDEMVLVLPVDPYVDVTFFEKVKELELCLNQSQADLALLGVKPTYPSSKYGYIVPTKRNNQSSTIHVSHFVEKPNEQKAKELIHQDALWNCGVFAFRLGYLIDLLKAKGLPVEHNLILDKYDDLPKISFDYEVVEKAGQIVALPFEGCWKDLGTWNTLTEEMEESIIGKGNISSDSINTHLINELDIPVAILGVSNTAIAVSADGILVTDKQASPRLKEMLRNFVQRPMYEERRWGWYRVLDHTKLGNEREVLTKRIGLHAGKNLSYQFHYKRSEVWTVISGEGEFVLNGELQDVKPGDVLTIPVEAKHSIKANKDLEIIEVQMGSELIEEDIIRLAMTWEEISQYII